MPHRTETAPNATEPDDEDPAPAVPIGERSGDDQERGQDRQVAAADVRLALEDAQRGDLEAPGRSASGRGSRPCCRGRRSPTRRSPRAGSSAGRGSCRRQGHRAGEVIARQCRTAADMLTPMPGPGPIALVGSGEFLPAMNEVDAGLLAATRPLAAPGRHPADRLLARRRGRLPALGGDGHRALRGARRRGRARPRPRPLRRGR